MTKIKLPEVTLLGCDKNDPSGILRAADICQREIEFGDVKIFTDHDFFTGRQGYSKWCLTDMWKHVDTSHVLIIHSDGYICNPQRWDDEWLEWDLIGSTFGYKDNRNAANGGFSLRSKKLLDILGQIDYSNLRTDFEDCLIGRYLRPWLEEEYDICFAPEHICNDFAIEACGSHVYVDSYGFRGNTYTDQFGFHGWNILGLPEPPIRKTIQTNLRTRIKK